MLLAMLQHAYKSRYFAGSVEVTDFLFSKMSTVMFTLLGCSKDVYFALTIYCTLALELLS